MHLDFYLEGDKNERKMGKMGRIDDAIRMYNEIINRPGIIIDLKREAKNKIDQLKATG